MPEYEVTLSGVASRLAQLSREMDSLTRALGQLDREAVEKRETFVMAFARAFLTAEGSMDVRRYIATEQTHLERFAAEAADCSVRDKKAQIRAVEGSVDVGRSVGSLVRSEIELEKVR
jgi:hypothetical protein